MNYELRIKLLVVAALLGATDCFAQKFPERREVRQGTRLYEKGDFTGAETEYRRALEIDPEMREARFNLGGALWRQEKLQEAAEAWMGIAADSLAPAPMVSAASYNTGNAALAGQQIDAAIEAYKAALRIRPDDMEAKYNLAYAQAMKREQEQQQNPDQNDQNDQNDQGGGGQDNQNQEGDGQNDEQNDEQNNEGDGRNDPNDQEGDGDQNDQNGEGDQPPPPSGQGQGAIDPRAAQQMLDAMQAAEDDTREKVNAREVQVGARSGKNW